MPTSPIRRSGLIVPTRRRGHEPDPVFMPVRDLAEHVRAGASRRWRWPRPSSRGWRRSDRATTPWSPSRASAPWPRRDGRRGDRRRPLPRSAARHSLTAPRICSPPGAASRPPGARRRSASSASAEDATVIRRLEAAGAVLCAKLAMIELAGGMGYRQPVAFTAGPRLTPWSRDAWSGGSSSGSGAAVSAGLVPSPSARRPGDRFSRRAAIAGGGLRPSYGRVSRHGAMALCWTLDTLGPLALTADDCGPSCWRPSRAWMRRIPPRVLGRISARPARRPGPSASGSSRARWTA